MNARDRLQAAYSKTDKDLSEAMSLTRAALDDARKHGDEQLVLDCLSFRAQLYGMLRKPGPAKADAEAALEGYRRLEDRRGEASVLNTLAIIRENEGQYQESFRLQMECLELLRQMDRPDAIAQLLSNLGLTCTYVGDWNQALEFYRESLDIWSTLPEQDGRGMALVNLGFAQNSLGKPEKAAESFREALGIYAEDNFRRRCVVLCNLAGSYCELGALDAAEDALRRAEAMCAELDDPARRAHALEARGALLRAQGDAEGSRACYESARDIYAQASIPRGEVLAMHQLGKGMFDRPGEAEALLRQAASRAESLHLKPLQAGILDDLTALLEQEGKWEAAHTCLKEKVRLEQQLMQEATMMKVQAMEMEAALRVSRRETEMERKQVAALGEAMKALEAQKALAEEESRQKSEILNFAAHDLRNLLMGIHGPARILEEELEERAVGDLLPWTGQLLKAIGRLEETLSLVLTAAAADSGRLQLERKDLLLSWLVDEAVAYWKPVAARKQQALNMLPSGEKVSLSADPTRISECLHNLISNACKYGPKGSSIEVGLRREAGMGVIFVADRGPGLSADDKRNLGRMFQKLSAKPTGGEMSIGVGLAVVTGIARLHGGRLEVHDRAGGGSIFELHLPEGPPPDPAAHD